MWASPVRSAKHNSTRASGCCCLYLHLPSHSKQGALFKHTRICESVTIGGDGSLESHAHTQRSAQGAAHVSCAPATPPGMRVRTGRFEKLRLWAARLAVKLAESADPPPSGCRTHARRRLVSGSLPAVPDWAGTSPAPVVREPRAMSSSVDAPPG